MRNTSTLLVALFLATAGLAAQAQTVTLKIATSAPEATPWVAAMRESAAEIEQRTAGRVMIKYYTGGVQGNDDQVRKKIRAGILQGGAFTPSALNDDYSDLNLYSLPLVFESTQEADFVRAQMDQKLIDGLAQHGYVTFGFAHTGFAMVMSNEPVHGVDDLRGKKVWVPEGDKVSFAAMEALHVSPVPLPLTDVMIGLQTRLIDIATVSPVGALFLQWYTRVKYITDMPLVYTYGMLAIDKRVFDKISAPDQTVVSDVMSKVYAKFDKSAPEDNKGALEAILNKGLELVPVNETEMQQIRQTISETNRTLVDQGVVSAGLYDEMLQLIQQYRQGSPGANAQVAAAHD